MVKSNKEALKCNKYRGVRMRRWGSWVSEIRAPKYEKTRRIWLGSYSTAEAAARAYDAALLCLRGPSATFNFPHHITTKHYPHHVDPVLLSPKSIQRVAAAAAAGSFFPETTASDGSSCSSGSCSTTCGGDQEQPTTTTTPSDQVLHLSSSDDLFLLDDLCDQDGLLDLWDFC